MPAIFPEDRKSLGLLLVVVVALLLVLLLFDTETPSRGLRARLLSSLYLGEGYRGANNNNC
jgi:hypothetical protein